MTRGQAPTLERMSSFVDTLFEPERHCSCGHHEGSHNHGFTNHACMWCECRTFVDGDGVAMKRRPQMRRVTVAPR